MSNHPSYEELRKDNELLRSKLNWLEGVYHEHRSAGEQIKSRFLSNISHELRTPVNSIVGFSDLLKYEHLTYNERQEYVNYINFNSRTLLNVMDNLIDLTLLETNNMELKKEEVYAEDIFREIYEYYNVHIVRSMHFRVALLMKTPGDYDRIALEADSYRLYRILDNLVNSAISQQTKGVIEMIMDIHDEKRVVFSVISNKNELLEERAKMIFENSENRDDWHNYLDFTGLSFKLARELAMAMGGFVSLLKVDGKRTGISLDLPINKIGTIRKRIA